MRGTVNDKLCVALGAVCLSIAMTALVALVFLLVTGLGLTGANGRLTIYPVSVAAVAGETVTFRCATNLTRPAIWRFYQPGDIISNILATGRGSVLYPTKPLPFGAGKTTLEEGEDGAGNRHYDLRIDAVTPANAGVYVCHEKDGQRAGAPADLTVLRRAPRCWLRALRANEPEVAAFCRLELYATSDNQWYAIRMGWRDGLQRSVNCLDGDDEGGRLCHYHVTRGGIPDWPLESIGTTNHTDNATNATNATSPLRVKVVRSTLRLTSALSLRKKRQYRLPLEFYAWVGYSDGAAGGEGRTDASSWPAFAWKTSDDCVFAPRQRRRVVGKQPVVLATADGI